MVGPVSGGGGGDYRVKSGDTLWDIAQRNGIDLKDLIAANPQIKNPDLIFPGQMINMPGAKGSLGGKSVTRSASPSERPSFDRPSGSSAPERSGGTSAVNSSAARGSLARALDIAKGEMGVNEIVGSAHNKRILEYHATTGGFGSDEVPWCASFVNWVMKEAGIKGTGSAMANSFLNWGRSTSNPKPGDVVVFGGSGHVGFFLGFEGNSVKVLGGNQSNSVKVSYFPRSNVAGFRTL